MQIGHTGHTRPMEIIVSAVFIVVAIRVAVPIDSAVYTNLLAKAVFALAIAGPSVWLLSSRTLAGRKRALVGVLVTGFYSGLLTIVVDPTRFASAGALLGHAAIAGYLYFVAAREVACRQDGSLPSSPQAPPSPGTSSRN